MSDTNTSEKLQKVLARAGLGSRRVRHLDQRGSKFVQVGTPTLSAVSCRVEARFVLSPCTPSCRSAAAAESTRCGSEPLLERSREAARLRVAEHIANLRHR